MNFPSKHQQIHGMKSLTEIDGSHPFIDQTWLGWIFPNRKTWIRSMTWTVSMVSFWVPWFPCTGRSCGRVKGNDMGKRLGEAAGGRWWFSRKLQCPDTSLFLSRLLCWPWKCGETLAATEQNPDRCRWRCWRVPLPPLKDGIRRSFCCCG